VTLVTNSIKRWISEHRFVIFPFLAFIIPVAIRTIPEILIGPYIIGFDTLAFYVPNTLLWLHNGINLWNFLSIAPLFYSIYMSLVSAGASPVFLIKIISPLLLGFLGLSMFFFAKRGLSWSLVKSTFVAVLGTVYFVALRASWDQLRVEFSLVFFFVVLMLLVNQKNGSWKRYVLLASAMLLVVLSDQIGAVIMLGVMIFTIVPNLFHKRYNQALNLTVASLPAALYFVIVYFISTSVSGILGYSNVTSPLVSWTGFASYQSMLINEAGFFLYCFLPLLPLMAISFKQFGNLQLRSWLLLSLILLLIPTSVSPYRWLLMLVYPIAFYATESLSRLKTIRWKRSIFTLQRIAVLYLVLSTTVLSLGFIFMTSQQPLAYFDPKQFNAYLSQIPTSMLQNTISAADCQSTVNVLQWFKENVNSSALLLTHTAFYGWALLTLNVNQVRYYGFEDPATAAMRIVQEGHTQIYLIWWVNGKGWYGQPTVSSSFHEIYHSGEIAIYKYASN